MVIMLHIFSAFAYLSAGCVLVLGVFDFTRENLQVEQILKQPNIIERFEKICDKQNNPAEESSPLVVQARAFASYLNPPPPLPNENKENEKILSAAEYTPSQNTTKSTKTVHP